VWLRGVRQKRDRGLGYVRWPEKREALSLPARGGMKRFFLRRRFA